jgi:hypothetical protein
LDICKAIIGGGDDPKPEIAAGRSAILDLITEKMQDGPLPRSNKEKEAENSDGFFKKLMDSIKNFGCLK